MSFYDPNASYDPNTGVPLDNSGNPIFDVSTLNPAQYITPGAGADFFNPSAYGDTSGFGSQLTQPTPNYPSPTTAYANQNPLVSPYTVAQQDQQSQQQQTTRSAGDQGKDDGRDPNEPPGPAGEKAPRPPPGKQPSDQTDPNKPPPGMEGRYPGTWKQPPPGQIPAPPPTNQERQQYNIPKLSLGTPSPQNIGRDGISQGPLGMAIRAMLTNALRQRQMMGRMGEPRMMPRWARDPRSGRMIPLDPRSGQPLNYPGPGPGQGQPGRQITPGQGQPPASQSPQLPTAPGEKRNFQNTMNQVAEFEGWDKGKWDAGQYSTGPGVKARYPGEQVSRAEGMQRLQEELAPVYNRMRGAFPNMPGGALGAVTSFSHNVGTGWMQRDRALRDMLFHGDYLGAARRMQNYVHVKGRVVSGLINRRRAEARMMLRSLPPDPFSAPGY